MYDENDDYGWHTVKWNIRNHDDDDDYSANKKITHV